MAANLDLQGKKALVTGASKGIGRAIALELARWGADCILAARSITELATLAEEICCLGRNATPVCTDVSDPASINELFTHVVPAAGGIDIFVNNAGITRYKHLLDTTPEEIDDLLRVNLIGAIHCLTAATKQMVQQQRGGSVIIVTSINAMAPLPSQAVYSSTKAALEALMKCLAADLAVHGIRVNTVVPGAIETDMNPHFASADVRARVEKNVPLGRIGMPEDIGGAVAFLSSPAAAYITGASIVVDGGYLLRR